VTLEFPDDPLLREYWEGCVAGQLRIQRCDRCGHAQFYPRPRCLACGGATLSWVEATGSGTLYSATTVWREVIPEFDPPYRVGLVDLVEGPRLLALLIDDAPLGAMVGVRWIPRDGRPPLPAFATEQRSN